MPHSKGWGGAVVLAASIFASPALAQDAKPTDGFREEIEVLKQQQQQTLELFRKSQDRIDALEARLASKQDETTVSPDTPMIAALPGGAIESGVGEAHTAGRSGLDISGDMRLRYETNFGSQDSRGRGRAVLRARIRAEYQMLGWLKVGAELTTGDPDDPNTADVTLSNFVDDLQVSLDQSYLLAQTGDLTATGGKFANPFIRTDLVWDGDVRPQGVAVQYELGKGNALAATATGGYFFLDEAARGPDSSMAGWQLAVNAKLARTLQIGLFAAYYDYSIESIAGGDAGDFRSNLLRPDGSYLSDFELFDTIGRITWSGFSPRWPINVTGEYVRNLGAAVDARNGYLAAVAIGRSAEPADWHFEYGYMTAQTDAVLAAFSHDNIGLGTDYLLHSLSVDYVLNDNLLLNGTFYHYASKVRSDPSDPLDWQQRVRFNIIASF